MKYMIAEQRWCNEAARLLEIPEPDGLRAVLAMADGDRDRAWRFAYTLRLIGLCPVEVARATLRAAGLGNLNAGGNQL